MKLKINLSSLSELKKVLEVIGEIKQQCPQMRVCLNLIGRKQGRN